MSGGVLAEVVAYYPGMHYCADRSFSSFLDVAKDLVPFFGRFVGRYNWVLNPIKALEKLTGSAIILTNAKDEVIKKTVQLRHHLARIPHAKKAILIDLQHKPVEIPLTRSIYDRLVFSDEGIAAHNEPLDRHVSGFNEYVNAVRSILGIVVGPQQLQDKQDQVG